MPLNTGQNSERMSMFYMNEDDSDIWKFSKKNFSSSSEKYY